MNLIGISGRIGSGKDTVGKIIQDLTMNSYQQSPWHIKKFAGKLKQIVSILTGIPAEDLEKMDVKDRVLGLEWDIKGFWTTDPITPSVRQQTVREILQRVGTEAMRDNIHPNIWVNALFADYKKVGYSNIGQPDFDWANAQNEPPPDYPKWVITDMRFPNEAEAVKERGGLLLRVIRENKDTSGDGYAWTYPHGWVKYPEHPSENSLDNYTFHETIINDGTIDELKEKVKQILIKHGICNKDI